MTAADARAIAALRLRRTLRTLAEARAELATAAALLGGWTLLTHGVAALLPRVPVWSLSAGLLLVSLCGWELLWTMGRKGLYTLSREDRRG